SYRSVSLWLLETYPPRPARRPVRRVSPVRSWVWGAGAGVLGVGGAATIAWVFVSMGHLSISRIARQAGTQNENLHRGSCRTSDGKRCSKHASGNRSSIRGLHVAWPPCALSGDITRRAGGARAERARRCTGTPQSGQ